MQRLANKSYNMCEQALFTISKESPILLYGAGEVGHRFLEKLLQKNYTPVGFIDQVVTNDELLPVYTLTTIPEAFVNEKTIVFICLANGMSHQNVALTLHEIGFNNICYLPLSLPVGSIKTRKMIESYGQVLGMDTADFGELPTFKSLNSVYVSSEDSVISCSDKVILAWVPYNLIYVLDKHNWKGNLKKIFISESICDKCIASFKEYVDFFNFLESGEGSIELYKNLILANDELLMDGIELKISEREQLFRVYKSHLNRGMDFFIFSAPFVSWNDNGYFNLLDGHHRTIFLYTQNFVYLPVKMNIEDFHRWGNREKLLPVLECLSRNKIVELVSPVEHPAFINYPSLKEGSGKTILASIIEFLSDEPVAGQTILDLSGYSGYFARHLLRFFKSLGSVCIEPDIELPQVLNDLLNTNDVQLYSSVLNMDKDSTFDFAIVMFSFREKLQFDFIDIANMTTKFIFVELLSERVLQFQNKISKQTAFQCYKVLKRYLLDGKPVELGVFCK